MPLVLTIGETMALIDPLEDGPLEYGHRIELRIAGAESNFAIALSRLESQFRGYRASAAIRSVIWF